MKVFKPAEPELTFSVNRGNVAEEPHSHFQDVCFLKLGVASLLEKIIKKKMLIIQASTSP